MVKSSGWPATTGLGLPVLIAVTLASGALAAGVARLPPVAMSSTRSSSKTPANDRMPSSAAVQRGARADGPPGDAPKSRCTPPVKERMKVLIEGFLLFPTTLRRERGQQSHAGAGHGPGTRPPWAGL